MFVLMWKYSDNSAFGIVAVSNLESKLQLLLDTLQSHAESPRTFWIEEVKNV